MIRATIWGRDVEMQGSPLTLLRYRREFGGDLLADLVDNLGGGTLPLEWLMRACWAMCATADPSIPGYEQWLAEFPEEGFDLAEPVSEVILSAVTAELFRPRETGRAARARRRAARWLGALSRRLGA